MAEDTKRLLIENKMLLKWVEGNQRLKIRGEVDLNTSVKIPGFPTIGARMGATLCHVRWDYGTCEWTHASSLNGEKSYLNVEMMEIKWIWTTVLLLYTYPLWVDGLPARLAYHFFCDIVNLTILNAVMLKVIKSWDGENKWRHTNAIIRSYNCFSTTEVIRGGFQAIYLCMGTWCRLGSQFSYEQCEIFVHVYLGEYPNFV